MFPLISEKSELLALPTDKPGKHKLVTSPLSYLQALSAR